jgi:pyruvate, orthophosphate dikinase
MSETMTGTEYVVVLDGSNLPSLDQIGGKAWSIARMLQLRLPVPPAFVITADACRYFHQHGGQLPPGLMEACVEAVGYLEEETGREFGGMQHPLLVSARSGAAVSMPGMMDTVLNLGINDASERALSQETKDPAFAREVHRRFCEMFSRIVLRNVELNLNQVDPPAVWREEITKKCGQAIPQDPYEQLRTAIQAVFKSWNSRRATRYREHHGISDELGTAVAVQAMVFGNAQDNSGTGVLFSRNPLTGERKPYGEYLLGAQGEDVVSGMRTPESLDRLGELLPNVYDELLAAAEVLEAESHDMQDIEFTVERAKLFLLQTRAAKRSPAAAVKVAVDFAREGKISPDEALMRVSPDQVRILLRKIIPGEEAARAQVLARGEAACPGVGTGIVVEDASIAQAKVLEGEKVVLARPTTSPEDLHGMIVASAVITEQGGSTCHAAVVCRSLGVPCIVGCGRGTLDHLLGRRVTVDGSRGAVYADSPRVEDPQLTSMKELVELERWAVAASPLHVYEDGSPVPESGPVLDLDFQPPTKSWEELAAVLSSVSGARGKILASNQGVQAAVAAGLQFIIAPQKLPALIAACKAQRQQSRGESVWD